MFNKILTLFTLVLMLSSCQTEEKLAVEIFETAASGNKLTQVAQSDENTATTVDSSQSRKSISNHYRVWGLIYGGIGFPAQSVES